MVSASSKGTQKNFLNGFFNSIRRENPFIYKWYFGNIVAFMDLIYSREIIFSLQENILFILYKNAHPRQKITIYVTGVLKKDARINTEELNFLENK